jgi:hypothetical protein
MRRPAAAAYNDSLNDALKKSASEGEGGESDWSKYVRGKLEAAFWIVLSYVILLHTELISVILYDDAIHSPSLTLGVALFGVEVCIALFLHVFVKMRTGDDDWNNTHPRTIYAATFLGLLMCLCFNISLWPVFGWVTPAMLFCLFLGFINLFNFLPF